MSWMGGPVEEPSRTRPSTHESVPGQPPSPAAEGADSFVGVVRNLDKRNEGLGGGTSSVIYTYVYSFMLTQYADGAKTNAIPVEMRGDSFAGVLNEGDEVRVPGPRIAGKPLRPTAIYNMSADAPFELTPTDLYLSRVSQYYDRGTSTLAAMFGGGSGSGSTLRGIGVLIGAVVVVFVGIAIFNVFVHRQPDQSVFCASVVSQASGQLAHFGAVQAATQAMYTSSHCERYGVPLP